jgi:hypothetical protein
LTLGFEGLDYEGGEDLELGRARQAVLVARDERIAVDGRVGPECRAAAGVCQVARCADVVKRDLRAPHRRHRRFGRWKQVDDRNPRNSKHFYLPELRRGTVEGLTLAAWLHVHIEAVDAARFTP